MKNITGREKRLSIAMLTGTAVAVLFALFTDFTAQCEQMYGAAFRFHILANSDSGEDQQIKIQLRDYILTEFGGIFAGCKDKESAKRAAQQSLPLIEARAGEFLSSIGCEYGAVCTVTNTEFPTRMYGDYTLPAGNYDALRITLGAGEGHNWWCVLYPSVCLDAAAVRQTPFPKRELYEREKLSRRRTYDALADEHEGVQFRFALYEALRNVFGF